MNDNFPILPKVRDCISRLAGLAGTGLTVCAVAAVAEITLFLIGLLLPGLICGVISSAFFALSTAALAVLFCWAHHVLLLERGLAFTRWLSNLIAFFAVVYAACKIFTLLTGTLLLQNQELLPYLLCGLLQLIFLMNLPYMAAAGRLLKIRLGFFPVLMLLIFFCDQPGLLIPAAIAKLVFRALLASPLRELRDLAPRIISMPAKESTENENQG